MSGALRAVLMAKCPVPGRVKTRLVAGGAMTEGQAAELAWAMIECTVARLAARFDVVLAVTGGDDPRRDARFDLARLGLPTVPQGEGDLGARLRRVWASLGERPVAFFGMDSPDVPAAALDAIAPAVAVADVALGPTTDGGYWTLAAGRRRPELLRDIDWGGPGVYDQTRRRAEAAGLRVHRLPPWTDVDRPEDVGKLRDRLRRSQATGSGETDEALTRLAAHLDRLFPARSDRARPAGDADRRQGPLG